MKYFLIYLSIALASFVALSGASALVTQRSFPPASTWYVSGWRPTVTDPITGEKVMVCQGKDSLDALTSCGLTVWSSADWNKYQASPPTTIGVIASSKLLWVQGGYYQVCVDDQCVDLRDIMRWMQHQIAILPK